MAQISKKDFTGGEGRLATDIINDAGQCGRDH